MCGHGNPSPTQRRPSTEPLLYIDNKRVSEGIWKRRYVRALETELDELHGKLAKIYEII